MYRIQVLVWFLCAVLLETNHGLVIPIPRLFSRRRLIMLSYFPPRTSVYMNLVENEATLSSPTFLDGGARSQDSFTTFLLLLSCGMLAGILTLPWRRRSSVSTKNTKQLQQSNIFPSLSCSVMLLMAAVTMLFILQATTLSPSSLWFSIRVLTHMISTAIRRVVSWYLSQLDSFPILTKSLTAGVISWFGDYSSQMLEHRVKNRKRPRRSYHVRRGLASLVDGICISGPVMHWVYDWLEQISPAHASNTAVMVHVVADSLLLDSLFVATEIIGTGLVEGYKFRQDILPQLERDYADTLKAGWATSVALIPIEYVCFRYFPLMLRTVVMNLADVVWGGVVSFMTHRNRQTMHDAAVFGVAANNDSVARCH